MITGFSYIGHVVKDRSKTLQLYHQLFDPDADYSIKTESGADHTSLLPIGDNIIMVELS